jgi:hypothetical protein
MKIYKLFHNRKKLLIGSILILGLLGVFGVQQTIKLDEAHSNFDKYYAFRGCTQLLKRTNAYGVCKTNTGETIKIVKYHNKWYLDGDLPCGFLCF